jgi:hypothetical protein
MTRGFPLILQLSIALQQDEINLLGLSRPSQTFLTGPTNRARCYKTFYDRNLQTILIS